MSQFGRRALGRYCIRWTKSEFQEAVLGAFQSGSAAISRRQRTAPRALKLGHLKYGIILGHS